MTVRACFAQLFCVIVLAVAPAIVDSAVFEGLYEASVPFDSRDAEQRQAGFEAAMRAVLVRVSGLRDVGADPAAQALIENANSYVQQFRQTAEGELWVSFDGRALERDMVARGLPFWGSNRPATLLWLAVDYSGGNRKLMSADDDSEFLRTVELAAQERGIPLVLPLMDSADRENLSFSDVCGWFHDKIRNASERYLADAVLTGCARPASTGGLIVDWILYLGAEQEMWRGRVGDGIQRAADRFSTVYATRGATGRSETILAVSGLQSFEAYGRVYHYLENLTLTEAVTVEQAAGGTVMFRVAVRGETSRLERALEVGGVLQPMPPGPTTPVQASALNYRYRP